MAERRRDAVALRPPGRRVLRVLARDPALGRSRGEERRDGERVDAAGALREGDRAGVVRPQRRLGLAVPVTAEPDRDEREARRSQDPARGQDGERLRLRPFAMGRTASAPAIRNTGAETETKSQSMSSSPCRKYAGSASASASCGAGSAAAADDQPADRAEEESHADEPGLAQELDGQAVRLDRLVEARLAVAQVRDVERAGAGAVDRVRLPAVPGLLPPPPAEVRPELDEPVR